MCFQWEHERFAKDANVEKMAKFNIRILGSKRSPNMRRGLVKLFAGLRQLFVGVVFSSVGISKKVLKFLANVSSIPRTIDDASKPLRMIGEL